MTTNADGVAIDASVGRHFHEQILEYLADGVYFVAPDRTITYWNRGAERLTGYPAAAVVGRRCNDNVLAHVDADGVNLCEGRCPLVAAVSDGRDHEMEAWLRHADGSRHPVRVRTTPIRDDAGTVIGAVEVFDDETDLVAARRQAEAAQRDALVDELTRLPNRRFLGMMLAARLEDLQRYGTPFSVLMADIDHFKLVNDQYGHATGDEALRVVAATLKGAVRAGDLVGRWGGEEFMVLAQHASGPQAMALAERLRALVASATVLTPAGPAAVSVSVGAAVAMLGESAPAIMERADRALYAAKAAGRNATRLAD
jgi:diguanylate cyclase (GGDEF)-like protein/PAS domain S-box-containing protein